MSPCACISISLLGFSLFGGFDKHIAAASLTNLVTLKNMGLFYKLCQENGSIEEVSAISLSAYST